MRWATSAVGRCTKPLRGNDPLVFCKIIVWTPLAQALRIAGGLYLVWLSVKSLRSALSDNAINQIEDSRTNQASRAFGRGLLVHLTNPKAVLSWLATVAIGTSSSASPASAFIVVAVCWCIGIVIFVDTLLRLLIHAQQHSMQLHAKRLMHSLRQCSAQLDCSCLHVETKVPMH